jgi:hypothetical protein
MYCSPSSQSALFAMMALVPLSSKDSRLVKVSRIWPMLASICSLLSSWRDSSLPEGSPTLVVPPPIRAIGRCPVFCSQRSIMICTRWPMCRESAVASKPI